VGVEVERADEPPAGFHSVTMPTKVPNTLEQLTERYDASVFELARPSARVRLAGAGPEPMDAVLNGSGATLEPASSGRPDALLTAD
jgi:hypothetical protein